MAGRTTVISTGSRGTGTISRPDRIGRTIGNLTTIPIIAGARRDASERPCSWGSSSAATIVWSLGLKWNQALEAGGVLVGDRVDIELEVQAVKAAAVQAA